MSREWLRGRMYDSSSGSDIAGWNVTDGIKSWIDGDLLPDFEMEK